METKKRNAITMIAFTPRPAAPIFGVRQEWSALDTSAGFGPAAALGMTARRGVTALGASALEARAVRRRAYGTALAGNPHDSAPPT
ncbi:hypothetical protein [Cellulomonas chengniuliangii]|uniref:Uncharacterized protein n=1 Tax=Cellulomonas chengniuliangii TaxID=2968084 RepID=A0ABY5KZV4_9CELL|nr:hypothetical protein [Cellulomonas chengniuliangii]MCC2309774.1 hypothetical protein [Cellulomonas chengniuliangii]MCC2319070.1 hypothetical protein [Cellulomonas chengniuliangii]UUI74680.1 hypothetical protein NP064_12925 [Cellulomonas chengniuliangii]